jgi:hypothetical protein
LFDEDGEIWDHAKFIKEEGSDVVIEKVYYWCRMKTTYSYFSLLFLLLLKRKDYMIHNGWFW